MTPDPELGDLEEQLRRALHKEAARINVAGDGLHLIRERLTRRRRRMFWLRPTMAAAAATVVVAAVLTVPAVVRFTETNNSNPADLADSPATTSLRSPSPTPSPSPNETGTLSSASPAEPSATPETPGRQEIPLPNLDTVWPYASRDEGRVRADEDVQNRVYPRLRDARQTAVDFVQTFVGTHTQLASDGGTSLSSGIGVTVSRILPGGKQVPVTVVYLVRVRKADDSPYVVVDARAAERALATVTFDDGVGLNGTNQITVSGRLVTSAPSTTVDPEGSDSGGGTAPAATVKVELREPGDNDPVAVSPATFGDLQTSDTRIRPWLAVLSPRRALAGTGALAVWTVDTENNLLSFAVSSIG